MGKSIEVEMIQHIYNALYNDDDVEASLADFALCLMDIASYVDCGFVDRPYDNVKSLAIYSMFVKYKEASDALNAKKEV